MSAGLEVKKPIRFFFFFGLFLAFVLLGVRACNERQTQEEVAEVEKILNENQRALVPSQDDSGLSARKKELSADQKIQNAKNSLIDSNSSELDIFAKKEEKKASKTSANKTKPPKKPVVETKSVKKAAVATKPKPKTVKPKKVVEKKPVKAKEVVSESGAGKVKMKILVSGQGYKLDPISQAKLKGAVSLNSKPSKVKILLFSNDPQGRSIVVKRAELKSSLIRAGLSTTTNIEFQTVDRTGFAEILFY